MGKAEQVKHVDQYTKYGKYVLLKLCVLNALQAPFPTVILTFKRDLTSKTVSSFSHESARSLAFLWNLLPLDPEQLKDERTLHLRRVFFFFCRCLCPKDFCSEFCRKQWSYMPPQMQTQFKRRTGKLLKFPVFCMGGGRSVSWEIKPWTGCSWWKRPNMRNIKNWRDEPCSLHHRCLQPFVESVVCVMIPCQTQRLHTPEHNSTSLATANSIFLVSSAAEEIDWSQNRQWKRESDPLPDEYTDTDWVLISSNHYLCGWYSGFVSPLLSLSQHHGWLMPIPFISESFY